MSNMKITFWHDYASVEATNVPMQETSLAVGTLSTTFYLGATDAQTLLANAAAARAREYDQWKAAHRRTRTA